MTASNILSTSHKTISKRFRVNVVFYGIYAEHFRKINGWTSDRSENGEKQWKKYCHLFIFARSKVVCINNEFQRKIIFSSVCEWKKRRLSHLCFEWGFSVEWNSFLNYYTVGSNWMQASIIRVKRNSFFIFQIFFIAPTYGLSVGLHANIFYKLRDLYVRQFNLVTSEGYSCWFLSDSSIWDLYTCLAMFCMFHVTYSFYFFYASDKWL